MDYTYMYLVLPAQYLLSYRKQSLSTPAALSAIVSSECMSTPKFSVAICGGGIAGLTTAIALSRLSAEKKDIQIDIYEAASKYSEIGAGVAMWRRPWTVMKLLGLDKALRKIVEVPAEEDKLYLSFELRKSDQAEGVSFYQIFNQLGNLTMYRAHLLDVLVEELDNDTTTSHFSKRLVSYTLPETSDAVSPIVLSFKDRSTATCDVLIGCDGIHSAVRETLLELAVKDAEKSNGEEGKKRATVLRSVVDPVWSGSVAYRGVIPRGQLEELNPHHRAFKTSQNYIGKNKHLIVFPMSKGRLVNVVAFCSWPDKEGTIYEGKMVEERTQEELLKQYEGWEDEVQQLLQCIKKPSLWAINNLQAVPTSVHNRVALSGDAAHAMTPHLGSGAGQAIEDAYILAVLLAHPLTTRETLQDALKIYETVRLPHANEVQRLSRLNGKLYELADPRFAGLDIGNDTYEKGKPREYDEKKLRDLGDEIKKNWEWAWTTDIEDDAKRAINLFVKRVANVDVH